MLKDLLKTPVSGVLVGAGVVLLAPIVLPVVARAARPLAKTALHGFFALTEGVQSLMGHAQAKRPSGKAHPVAAEVGKAAKTAGEEVLERGMAEVIVQGVTAVLEEA
jgi:hypothetical protein